jgi:hypothetical protein
MWLFAKIGGNNSQVYFRKRNKERRCTGSLALPAILLYTNMTVMQELFDIKIWYFFMENDR